MDFQLPYKQRTKRWCCARIRRLLLSPRSEDKAEKNDFFRHTSYFTDTNSGKLADLDTVDRKEPSTRAHDRRVSHICSF